MCPMNPLASGEVAGWDDAAVLEYTTRILLEEDVDERDMAFLEPSLLEAAERSLYQAIGGIYDQSPNHRKNFDEVSPYETSSSSGDSNSPLFSPALEHDTSEDISAPLCYYSSPAKGENLIPLLSAGGCVREVSDDVIEFLPWEHIDLFNLQNSGAVVEKTEVEAARRSDPGKERAGEPIWKRNPIVDEDQARKQLQRYSESEERSEIFDKVLLCKFNRESEANLRETFQRMVLSERAQAKDLSTKAKGSAKKGRRRSRDVVDLQSLLTLCAQAVSACDKRGADDLLTQIRRHASPRGDGMQRLAYYLAKGIESRLAGHGTEIYNNLNASWPVKDVIHHHHLFLAICPFRKAANFFTNKTIANLAEKYNKVHVVDFGSSYGLQWPSLIERLSNRSGGPPELRLTAINLPQPGFRPTERLEATGRRLASYAETFKVPFKYEAIASKWSEVKVEDIRIETDEVMIVNCINRLEELLDESVVEESPRDAFLNLIRKINPRLFIQGTVNSGHGSPFFNSRFREALFYFATIFDVLDATVPRDNPERILLEQETFGRKVMNVVACEGPERIDRPETYKRWHQRNIRAGFAPVPVDRGIMNKAKDEIARRYHKDFEVEEDGCWLLQGWKGRIVHAISTWRPATSTSNYPA